MIHGERVRAGQEVNGVAFIGSDGKIFVNRGYKAQRSRGDHQAAARRQGRAPLQIARPSARLARTASARASKPICDVEIGARSVTVCHLGNLAYWNHRKLRWDPKEWQFVNDAEANKWLDRERREPWQLPLV